MSAIVYKTRNKINGKIYVGVHRKCDDESLCNYLGSGHYINKAFKKYGRENFVRTILYEFENEQEAFLKEKEIVNRDFIKRSDTYNITIGGRYGGFISDDTKVKISETLRGRILTEEHKRNISKAEKLRGATPRMREQLETLRQNNIGSKRTPESRRKMSLAHKRRFLQNDSNSQEK